MPTEMLQSYLRMYKMTLQKGNINMSTVIYVYPKSTPLHVLPRMHSSNSLITKDLRYMYVVIAGTDNYMYVVIAGNDNYLYVDIAGTDNSAAKHSATCVLKDDHINGCPLSQYIWNAQETLNGYECRVLVKICSPSPAMVTSPYK